MRELTAKYNKTLKQTEEEKKKKIKHNEGGERGGMQKRNGSARLNFSRKGVFVEREA